MNEAVSVAKVVKIERVSRELEKADPKGSPIGPFRVALADLRRDPIFQIRAKLDTANITRLTAAYRSGRDLPPIAVVFIEGEPQPLVVDGHHRCSALEGMGEEMVSIMAQSATKREALWLAAQANSAHGLPLKTSERRRMFGAYITARKHLKQGGVIKSLREIAPEVGVSYGTVRNWMVKDFPKIASRMGNEMVPGGQGGIQDGKPRPVLDNARNALSAFQAAFDAAPSWADREEMLFLMERMRGHLQVQHEERASKPATDDGSDF